MFPPAQTRQRCAELAGWEAALQRRDPTASQAPLGVEQCVTALSGAGSATGGLDITFTSAFRLAAGKVDLGAGSQIRGDGLRLLTASLSVTPN